jgi:HTH-type transcriptional regulator/antitoxin HigA
MTIEFCLKDVPHPGEFIREELEARGWLQRDLAYILGVPEQAVNMIVSGKRGISPEMAKALGQAFDVNPEFFANLQKSYEMANAKEPDPGIARRARWQAAYPVREMIKRGWLEAADPDLMEAQMMRFFAVNRVDDIPHLPHAAKKTHYGEIPPTQLAWLFRVRQIASEMVVPKYSEKNLREALHRLEALTIDPEEVRHVPKLLGDCGVRFVLVETLPGAKIDGVSLWLDGRTPVIGVTARFDRIDNFWFVLRHEIEHVLQKHGQKKEIVDEGLEGPNGSVNADAPEEERVANTAAQAFCVPQDEMESFFIRKAPFFSERDVVGFARRVHRHPGIVVGQIQRKTEQWNFLRRYQVKIRDYIASSAIVDGWGQVAPVTL